MNTKSWRLTGMAVLAAWLMAPGVAGAAIGGGYPILTNFVTGTYNLAGGGVGGATAPYDAMVKNCKDPFNVPCLPSRWICVTANMPLCLSSWKNVTNPSMTAVALGSLVCFEVGFCNCGTISGFSVTITDAVPPYTIMGDGIEGPQPQIWVNGGFGVTASMLWARNLAGPWYGDAPDYLPSIGQVGPLFLRFNLGMVGTKKTGYIRYCVTIQ